MSKGIITVRLIRSFEHRNIKHIIIHDVYFSQKVKLFKEYINNGKNNGQLNFEGPQCHTTTLVLTVVSTHVFYLNVDLQFII